MSTRPSLSILVAGDVCLDLVGVPVPPPAVTNENTDNWRLTGETRTYYLAGGAWLLADFVRAAVPAADVQSMQPCRPASLQVISGADRDQPLTMAEFADIAERLTRDEIVHSLLSLDDFRSTSDSKDGQVLRVKARFGFSGPRTGDPALRLIPPIVITPDIIILDDTGNRFRRAPELWPRALTAPTPSAVLVHKLHRPLPGAPSEADALWQATQAFPERIAIVSVDDLRSDDALISRGLSWERTALDVVWQLINRPTFASLRSCPHLIVQLGLDGAVYWQRVSSGDQILERAWLIYDPNGIEGAFDSSIDGDMVGYGSAFTAGLVQKLAEQRSGQSAPCALEAQILCKAIQQGLASARRLLRSGFGQRGGEPRYPGTSLFGPGTKEDAELACQPIPIIPETAVPDRGYWRLLDTIFSGKKNLLHRAVALTATGAKPATPDDRAAYELLKQVPMAVFAKALRTYDRREIENYRALYALMLDYVEQRHPPRPLSVAVFGPPGAGKSFGIKMVAKALSSVPGGRPIESLTFNLSQYQSPEQLADAFHLVRDLALRGKIPLVFFDEFDSKLGQTPLGWLRYFLAPMQDAEFLDRGAPHPIGQAIFVFAGGTCSTYTQFAEPFLNDRSPLRAEFQMAKGPDFLSRLRGTLDVPGLDLNVSFDAYGPVEAFPCEAAILLRRAGILAFQLAEKAPWLRDTGKTLRISPVVLRALLHLPHFQHGNRSFEAVLDMSHLADAAKFTPALLPAPTHAGLHADPLHFHQLLATDYPFPSADRELIAQTIHETYRSQRLSQADSRPGDPSLRPWNELSEDLKESNREQADHIAVKLRSVGLWFRKAVPGCSNAVGRDLLGGERLDTLARLEHDRWVAEKRRRGWIPATDTDRTSRNDRLLIHNSLVPWEGLSDEHRELDRQPVRQIPEFLAAAGYEVMLPY